MSVLAARPYDPNARISLEDEYRIHPVLSVLAARTVSRRSMLQNQGRDSSAMPLNQEPP